MLYKRGNIWWVKFKAQGHVIQRSAGTTLKREAQEVERALRDQVARELHAGRTGKPVVRTYAEALTKWINSGAPTSMWSHARNTKPYLDSKPLHLVVPAAHEMKASMLKDGLSPQTINRRLAVVRRVLNVAYREWDWLSGLPAELNAEKHEDLDFSDITSQYVSPWVGASGRVVTLEGQFTAAELRLIADRMEGKSQD